MTETDTHSRRGDYSKVMTVQNSEIAIEAESAGNGTAIEGIDDGDGQHERLIAVDGAQQKLPFPKSIYFIVGFEFCERFNSLGVQTIQVLYFTQKLMIDKDTTTVLFHTLIAMNNLMCILGAILSDCFLGKFKTILYSLLMYGLGMSVVIIATIPTLNLPATTTAAIGFITIAIGAGCLRPNVPSFGGDQFQLPAQSTQLASFFSIFYFASYAAYVLAIFTTPILRQDIHCFGEDDCYALAFGVPWMSLIIAIILFVSGKSLYKVNPPSGNALIQVTSCIKHAIASRNRYKTVKPRRHWLDYSEEKFGKQLVDETKALLKILLLFTAQPLYWSLISQQASRWVFQAQNMDGDIGFYKIKPDQIHVVVSIFMLIFIPLFNLVIYPLLARIGFRRPLQKMTAGLVVATLTFLLSAILELKIEKTYPIQPTKGEAQLRFINGLPCDFTVNTSVPSADIFKLNQFSMIEEKYIEVWASTAHEFTLISNDPKCADPISGEIVLNSETATTVFLSGREIGRQDVYTDSSQKRQTPMLRVLFSSLGGERPSREVKIVTPSDNNRVAFAGSSSDRRLISIVSGVHEVHIQDQNYETIELKDGSVSTLIVLETPEEQTKFKVYLIEITEPNSVSMLWQLPQYICMAMAEVLFTLTGYELAYRQAPANMKSVVQASFMMTIALGNIIVTIIAGARIFQSQSSELFLYTGLMVLDLLLFIILTRNYKMAEEPTKSIDESSKD